MLCDKSLDNVISVGLANFRVYLPFTDTLGVWFLDSGQDTTCIYGHVSGYIMTKL